MSSAHARVVQPQDLYWLYSFLKIPSQDKIWVNLDYTLPFQDRIVSRSILGGPLSDILLSTDLQLKLDTLRILEGLDYGSREVRFRIVLVPSESRIRLISNKLEVNTHFSIKVIGPIDENVRRVLERSLERKVNNDISYRDLRAVCSIWALSIWGRRKEMFSPAFLSRLESVYAVAQYPASPYQYYSLYLNTFVKTSIGGSVLLDPSRIRIKMSPKTTLEQVKHSIERLIPKVVNEESNLSDEHRDAPALAVLKISPKDYRKTGKIRVSLAYFERARDQSKVNFPLGISAIAGHLRERYGANLTVDLYHNILHKGADNIINLLRENPPDILGLSLGFGSLRDLEKVMNYVYSLPKNKRPLVVLGGLIPAYNYELLLRVYPDVIVSLGPGEEVMEGLVKYYQGEASLLEIPNIAFSGPGGRVIKTYSKMSKSVSRPYLDPALVNAVIETDGIMYMESSRGCPFNCAICSRRQFLGGGWRGAPVEAVVQDLIEVAKLGVRFVNLVDEDLFAGGTDRVFAFAEAILSAKEKGLLPKDFIFGTSASVRQILRKRSTKEENERRLEALRKMHEAGLKVLFVGIESGSPEQLKRYGKASTVEENKEVVKIIEDIGIYVIPGFIMADPLVTEEEILDNIKYLRETGMDRRITYPLKTYIPLKGSRLTDKLIEEGLVDGDTYLPDRLAFDVYYFKSKKVARALEVIKDWEESQALFFWELKILFRSAAFGALGEDRKSLLRKLVDEQTLILLDFLEEVITKDLDDLYDAQVISEIRKKYSNRLIKDIVEVLSYIDDGTLPIGKEELKTVSYEGLIREVIHQFFEDSGFFVSDLMRLVFAQYGYKMDPGFTRKVLKRMEQIGRIELIGDENYVVGPTFHKYIYIPWPDLPRKHISEKISTGQVIYSENKVLNKGKGGPVPFVFVRFLEILKRNNTKETLEVYPVDRDFVDLVLRRFGFEKLLPMEREIYISYQVDDVVIDDNANIAIYPLQFFLGKLDLSREEVADLFYVANTVAWVKSKFGENAIGLIKILLGLEETNGVLVSLPIRLNRQELIDMWANLKRVGQNSKAFRLLGKVSKYGFLPSLDLLSDLFSDAEWVEITFRGDGEFTENLEEGVLAIPFGDRYVLRIKSQRVVEDFVKYLENSGEKIAMRDLSTVNYIPLVYSFLSNRFPGSDLIPVESSIAAVSGSEAGGIIVKGGEL